MLASRSHILLSTTLLIFSSVATTTSATVLDIYGDWSSVPVNEPARQIEFDRLASEECAISPGSETITRASGLRPSDSVAVRMFGSDAQPFYLGSFDGTAAAPAVAIAPNYLLTASHVIPSVNVSALQDNDLTNNPSFAIAYIGPDGPAEFKVEKMSRSIFGVPDPIDLAILKVTPVGGSAMLALPDWVSLPQPKAASPSSSLPPTYTDIDGVMVVVAGMGPQRRRFIEAATDLPVGQSPFLAENYARGHGVLAWGLNILEEAPAVSFNETAYHPDRIKFWRDNPTSPSYLANSSDRSYFEPTRITSFASNGGSSVPQSKGFEAALLNGDSGSGFLKREGLGWSVVGAFSAGSPETSEFESRFLDLSSSDLTSTATRNWIEAQVALMGGVDLNSDGMVDVSEQTARLADLPTAPPTTVTWDIADPSQWGSWHVGGNWNTNAAPGSVDDVILVDGLEPQAGVNLVTSQVQGQHLIVGGTSRAHVAQWYGANVALTDVLMIGQQAGANGTYSLTDGELNSATTYVGYGGIGSFYHTEGLHQIRDTLYIGRSSGSTTSSTGCGTTSNCYELNGENAEVFARRIVVGALGSGRFDHVDGKVRAMRVTIGHGAGADGVYEQHGGSLVVSERLEIGLDGSGELVLQDASIEVNYQMEVTSNGGISVLPGSGMSTVAITGDSLYKSRLDVASDATITGAEENLHLIVRPDGVASAVKDVVLNPNDLHVKRLSLGQTIAEEGAQLSLSLESDLYVDELELLAGFKSGSGFLGAPGTNDPGIFFRRSLDGAYVRLIPGDANLDGSINSADFSAITGAWLTMGGWAEGDFSGDGFVDSADVSILSGNWLATATPRQAPLQSGSTIPEPTTLCVLFSGVAIAFSGGWRRSAQFMWGGDFVEDASKSLS